MKTSSAGFDWENIKYFLYLADTLNLDLASEALNTSSATVMRRVKLLEAQLGTTLFFRNRTGHVLTASGLRLKSRIGEAHEILNDACGELANQDKLVSGNVRITTTEVISQWVLLPEIAKFQANVPNLRIELDVNPASVRLNQELDTIAIRFQRPTQSDLVVKKLAVIRFSLYRAESVKFRIEKLRVIGPYIGWSSAHQQIRLARWQQNIFGMAEPVLKVSSMVAQHTACKLGVGIAALPDFIVSQRDQLVKVNAEDGAAFSMEMDAWLVVPSSMRKLTRVKASTKIIESAFAKFFEVSV
jgi:DNA-binding transcriptional LysR family regulator